MSFYNSDSVVSSAYTISADVKPSSAVVDRVDLWMNLCSWYVYIFLGVKIAYWSSFFHRNGNYYCIRVQHPRNSVSTCIMILSSNSNPSVATNSKSGVATSPTPKRAFKVLSPNVRLVNLTCTLSILTAFYRPLVIQPTTAETFCVFSIFFSYCCFHLLFTLFN